MKSKKLVSKKGNCESCGYKTTLIAYPSTSGGSLWVCDLCAQSPAGHINAPDHRILRTIAYIGNVLREEIRKK